MAASGIVPTLNVAEDRHSGLGLRCEPATCQQLTFQGCEEALAHGVIVGVTNRSHGWAHTGFPAAAGERQRCILGALVAVVDDIGRPATQSWFGRSAVKFRSTRSGAGRASRSRRVVMMPRRRLTPIIPAARISPGIRFLPTAPPSARNSACTRGAP